MGVSCYSSTDLYNWKNEGIVLSVSFDNEADELYFNKVLERPKAIYNEKTQKFVLWVHVDSKDCSFARYGVAISDCPTGPFAYLGSSRVQGNEMSRDMTIFKDDDGKAYHLCSSEDNATLYISQMNDDYTGLTNTFTRNFEKRCEKHQPCLNIKIYII